jgi:predicted nuclease of restriction endonuclease-like RecB superfamily
MGFEDIKFPVYRKYKNSKSYFKIINALLFEEIQVIGSKKIIRQTKALQYPEKLFVRDLLLNYHNMAVEITEAEYLDAAKTR